MSVATAVVVMAGVVMAVVVMAVVVMAVVLVLERGWRRRVSGRAAAGLAPRLRPAEDLRLGVRLVQLLRKALVRRLGRLIHRGKEGVCVACRGGGKRRAVVLAWRAGAGGRPRTLQTESNVSKMPLVRPSMISMMLALSVYGMGSHLIPSACARRGGNQRTVGVRSALGRSPCRRAPRP